MNIFRNPFATPKPDQPYIAPIPRRRKTPDTKQRRVRISLHNEVFIALTDACPDDVYMTTYVNELLIEALAAKRLDGSRSLRTKCVD